jgi:hypothetical protein
MSVVSQRDIPASDRAALIRAAFRIETITIAWMIIEGTVAIRAAIGANSLTRSAIAATPIE